MNVAIIGTGFVGVVSAAVYASLGHAVWGIDIDEQKVASLRTGTVPFFEPGLEELLKTGQADGKLQFTTDYAAAIPLCEIVVIAVGTPSSPEGKADLRAVIASARSLAPYLRDGAIVVVKSTVPPGTLGEIKKIISDSTEVQFSVASMPEFLKEGTAVEDTLHPDRVVIGADEPHVIEQLKKLNEGLGSNVLVVSAESAQLGKYASNAYLAMRIGFVNHVADLCERTGATIDEVVKIMGADRRIGDHYWYPGLGYGGSCFPKDVRELAYFSRTQGMDETILTALNSYNESRIGQVFEHWTAEVAGWQHKTVAVLGLSFKPNTNDMREAPSLSVVPRLIGAGASVAAYDPEALEEAAAILGHEGISYASTVGEAVSGADVIIALIEWPQIVEFQYPSVSESASGSGPRWFIDARNQFSPEEIRQLGYKYLGIGRPEKK